MALSPSASRLRCNDRSFTGAGIAGAVRAALAAILSPVFHLRGSLKARLLGADAHDEGLGGGLLGVGQVRVHLAPSAAGAALAAGATATVPSAARHLQSKRSW